MDYIRIDGITVYAHHGAFLKERVSGQEFVVCAELGTRIAKAAKDDDLEKTIDYGRYA